MYICIYSYLVLQLILESFPSRLAMLPNGLDLNVTKLLPNLLTNLNQAICILLFYQLLLVILFLKIIILFFLLLLPFFPAMVKKVLLLEE